MTTPKYLVGIPNSTDTERQFGKYTPTMIGGCGLGAKFCLTLAAPWTVANQAPLTLGFSRQEYWNGLHFLLQGIFLTQGSNPHLLCCRQVSCTAGRFFTNWATREAPTLTIKVKVKDVQSCSILCNSNSPGQNTGVCSHSLLQGIFPTQGSNPGLPHHRWILYQLSHKGSPRILDWVAYLFSSGSSWPRNRTRVSWIAGRFFTNWATR